MEQVGTGSGAAEWVKAHAELSEFARRRAALEWEEGTALLRALRSGAHRHLGYASFAEYVERLFGYSLARAFTGTTLTPPTWALFAGPWRRSRFGNRSHRLGARRCWADPEAGSALLALQELGVDLEAPLQKPLASLD